ncbi:MAG TPA: hypothetical protein VKH19_19520 [Gemmatimonadaceae bacterium]|nr:hypothetical protein [Gemmatimonadaceae bacterium]
MTTTTLARTALALAIFAAPLSAQIDVRRPDHGKGRSTTTTTTSDGAIYRNGSVLGGTSRTSAHIPPGQLPPRGMCRVWIDGVPPGQQPAVTDCATARRQALGRANARVIYGDEQSFPGNGKGKNKLKNRTDGTAAARSCSVWDVVVVAGKQVPVCRDGRQRGTVLDSRSRGRDDDNELDDDDGQERDNKIQRGRGSSASESGRGKSKRGKGKGHGDD